MPMHRNPDGSNTLLRDGRTYTLRAAEFERAETLEQMEARIGAEAGATMQCEVRVKVLERAGRRFIVYLGPLGREPAFGEQWWQAQPELGLGLLARARALEGVR